MPGPPPPRRGPTIGRDELRRRREEKLAELVASASRALDSGDQDGKFDEAQELVDEATLLSPEDPRVQALWQRLDAEAAGAGRGVAQGGPHPPRRALARGGRRVRRAGRRPAARLAPRPGLAVRGARAPECRQPAGTGRLADRGRRGDSASGRWAPPRWRSSRTRARRRRRGALVASAGAGDAADADGQERESTLDSGPDPVSAALGLGTDSSDGSDGDGDVLDERDSLFFQAGRVDGTSLSDIAGRGVRGGTAGGVGAGRRTPGPRVRTSAAGPDLAPAPAPEAPAAESAPAAPIVVARLCDDRVACGALRVRVQPAATILFNGVEVGSGAQGMLRLPAGRHQIRLRSDEHEFRRMVTIARGAPTSLEVDLADEGLPLLPR